MLFPTLRLICGAADVGGVNLVFSRALRTLFACEMTWNEKSLSLQHGARLRFNEVRARKVLSVLAASSPGLANKISCCDPRVYWMGARARHRKSRMSGARRPEKVKWVTRAEADWCTARSASVSWSVLKDPDCVFAPLVADHDLFCHSTLYPEKWKVVGFVDGITRRLLIRTRILCFNSLSCIALSNWSLPSSLWMWENEWAHEIVIFC